MVFMNIILMLLKYLQGQGHLTSVFLFLQEGKKEEKKTLFYTNDILIITLMQ